MKAFSPILGGLLLLGFGTPALADVGLGASWTTIQADFANSVGCRWTGTDTEVVCPLENMHGNIDVRRNDGAAEPETIEINPVIAGHRSGAAVEEYGQTVALKVLKYVLPNWQDGPAWLKDAFRAVQNPGTKRATKVGAVTILVLHLQPADLDDTYALVVITTRHSLEEWDYVDPL